MISLSSFEFVTFNLTQFYGFHFLFFFTAAVVHRHQIFALVVIVYLYLSIQMEERHCASSVWERNNVNCQKRIRSHTSISWSKKKTWPEKPIACNLVKSLRNLCIWHRPGYVFFHMDLLKECVKRGEINENQKFWKE